MTARTRVKVTSAKKGSSSRSRLGVMETESFMEKLLRREAMRKAYLAELQQVRDGLTSLKKDADITVFNRPGEFGDELGRWKILTSNFQRSVVSIALFHDEVLVFACSGTAVHLRHGHIQDPHIIYVTSARLALEFTANRTKDDKLRIELRTPDKTTMHGFLGLHDDNIAIVTTFSLRCLYKMDVCNPVDLPRSSGTRSNKLFAFGCADDSTLMGISCSDPVFQKDGLVSVNCVKITETGLGGPVICFGHGGSGHLAGVIVECCERKITFIPTKMLHELLQGFMITRKTSHFRGYSLPERVKGVIPSGFMVRSEILQSLGYPLPPPLVFELNGGLAGTFEEDFGQPHYGEGHPLYYPYSGYGKPIWKQLGNEVTEKISKSVVAIASFKDGKRYFACTGLLIKGYDCTDGVFVLSSASLIRTGDAQDEIDKNLTFKVFLPPGQLVDGILEMYHLNDNIAVFSLKEDLCDISPEDICNAEDPCTQNKVVVAIGRRTKERQGLLMASMGKVKCTINRRPKKKEHKGLDLNCKDLASSSCKIKKVGIGGPLVGLDGKFMGMNFYDESRTTPFLPSMEIVRVLKIGFRIVSYRECILRWPLDLDNLDHPITRESQINVYRRKRNRWPVSKPYWYLGDQGDVLDQLGGKVLM